MSGAIFPGPIKQEQGFVALERTLKPAPYSSGQEMTHAWLFEGPPGSRRSNMARAFAAALICKTSRSGECTDSNTVLAATRPISN